MALFAQITKAVGRENNLFTADIINKIENIIAEAVKIELDYAYYILDRYPVMGLNKLLLQETVENYANKRLRMLGLKEIYPNRPITMLQKLVNTSGEVNNIKTNFFESNVAAYAKNSIDMNDF